MATGTGVDPSRTRVEPASALGSRPLSALPEDLLDLLAGCPGWTVPRDRAAILRLALGDGKADVFDVAYDVPGRGRVVEATVTRCKNGLSINYPDPRMRRRDPDCLVVADDQPSDKDRYLDRFGEP